MMPNSPSTRYHPSPTTHPPHPHPHHSASRAEGRKYRGERHRERNIPPPPWPNSPSSSHATTSEYYGVHDLGGGYYHPPPPPPPPPQVPGSGSPYPYAPVPPPLPRHVPPPAATPPTVSSVPSPAPPNNHPPKLPPGMPPAPPPPPTISPPPMPYGRPDQYSHYPRHYYPPPLHPLGEYGPPMPEYHNSRGRRDLRERDYNRPPSRDRSYSIPPPMMDEFTIPPPPPMPPLSGYANSRRGSTDYGGPPRTDYMHAQMNVDYASPDPRDYVPPRGDYRQPREPYAPARDYLHMEHDYLHPERREYTRPKSEYEVEYQSAPPSRGQPSMVSSAVTRDDDGDGYSSVPPVPKELEYDGPAPKEIEYPGRPSSRARSRARSIREIEYHPSRSRAASRAPSHAPSTKEIREIEYAPRSHSIPPHPDGRREIEYYDNASEHHPPPTGLQEIEYLRPGTSHAKPGSDLASATRPPDPAIATKPHWPPPREETELDARDAADLISNGTPLFRGNLRAINGAPKGFYSFYVSAGNEWDDETDCAAFKEPVYGDMSSATTQDKALERPAMCHAFGIYPGTITLSCYVAGFSSLWRAGVNDVTGTELSLMSTGGGRVKVRKLSMIYVVDKLRNFQDKGMEENDPGSLHKQLYDFLLYEPPRPNQQGYSIEAQISDLTSALLRPSWVDFSLPENQVVSRFLRSTEPGVTNAFFHQLLLALELYLRIGVVHPQSAIAEKVSWDLVLAQRWLENVEIQPPKVAKEGSSSVSFGFKNKETQVVALKEFAWTLKWPNMHEVNITLCEDDAPDDVLEDRSTACMAWFTGLILPGSSMPFILMNALTDCDPDTPSSFHELPCTTPNVGFQYRGHTYWSWDCIVGSVLGAAKGVSQIAGWLGPCISSPDLDRAELVYINQRKPPASCMIMLSAADVRNMQAASDPLGPNSNGMGKSYQTTDYDLIIPDSSVQTDTIRIERLNFNPAAPPLPGSPDSVQQSVTDTMLEEVFSPLPPSSAAPPASTAPAPVPGGAGLGLGHPNVPGSAVDGSLATSALAPQEQPSTTKIATFNASITFAIRHRSWKVYLKYNTPFIAAYPCSGGPHVLYNKYYYRSIKVDNLVEIENWGPRTAPSPSVDSSSVSQRQHRRRRRNGSRHPNQQQSDDGETDSSISDSASDDSLDDDGDRSESVSSNGVERGDDAHLMLCNHLDEVLVVEAFGVHDNEVFARAWCSFWGVSAIMADLRKTCLACCVREAYAVGVSVVVLVDGLVGARKMGEEEVEEVDRKMDGLYV